GGRDRAPADGRGSPNPAATARAPAPAGRANGGPFPGSSCHPSVGSDRLSSDRSTPEDASGGPRETLDAETLVTGDTEPRIARRKKIRLAPAGVSDLFGLSGSCGAPGRPRQAGRAILRRGRKTLETETLVTARR